MCFFFPRRGLHRQKKHMKRKNKRKKPNPCAKDLRTPKYRMRVKPSKKKKDRDHDDQ